MSSFPRLPSVWDGPMVSRPDLTFAPLAEPAVVPHPVEVTVAADVAAWFRARGLDMTREINAILRAHIDAQPSLATERR